MSAGMQICVNSLGLTPIFINPETRLPEPVEYITDPITQQLISDNLFLYYYEQNGNLDKKVSKADGRTTYYEYNPFNQLIRVIRRAEDDPEASVTFEALYEYDWAGRRISKNVNGSITRYIYDGHNLVAEYNGAEMLLAVYYHLPGTIDRPLAMVRGSSTFYYHYDERGSVAYLTSASGNIVQKYAYDSYGRIVLQIGRIPNPFTYTGRQWDPETRLYHYRARWYDPDTKRFTQEDPVFESTNKYKYVDNNPMVNTDPYGLQEEDARGLEAFGIWVRTMITEIHPLAAIADLSEGLLRVVALFYADRLNLKFSRDNNTKYDYIDKDWVRENPAHFFAAKKEFEETGIWPKDYKTKYNKDEDPCDD